MTKRTKERVSFTIPEFLARHGLARSTYYELKGDGLGPQEMRRGRLIRISKAAEDAWVSMMEAGGPASRDDDEDERPTVRKKRRREKERDRR
ncbi:hypothetical protein ACM64Y_19385 [Novispirillum sp. DQ9]|uniref:hypothetical protein n=1 Tax=Novispirillum sp. DQ9 TaxID=3398612 RepID=UPI003C7C31C1